VKALAFTVALSLVTLGESGPGAGATAACRPWKIVPSPLVPLGSLVAGSAVSSSDIWAVGSNGQFPIAEHWDGAAWSLASLPGTHGYFLSVAAPATDDVWADGATEQGIALIEHWDGTTWKVASVPFPGTDSSLSGISAASTTDVWAVGEYTSSDGLLHGLSERWDGASWRQVPMPDDSPYANVFNSVAAIAQDDAWAVGYEQTTLDGQLEPLVEHWDGSSWSVSPSFVPHSGLNNELVSVSGSAADDVWAVGGYGNGAGYPLFEHWDGVAWTAVPVPRPSGPLEVASITSVDAWALRERKGSAGTGTAPSGMRCPHRIRTLRGGLRA
jgi:hypothetical protein